MIDTKILQLLERQPLTLTDLMYSFDTSIEVICPVVQSLLDQGLIDVLGAPILYIIFPFLGAERRRRIDIQAEPNPHLTLTAKGHFKLNPFITIDL